LALGIYSFRFNEKAIKFEKESFFWHF